MPRLLYLFVVFLGIVLVQGCTSSYENIDTTNPAAGPIYDEQEPASPDTENPILKDAEPYLLPIITSDIELRSKASSVVRNCPSGDKTCQVHEIYRYVVENYKYIADPRRDQIIQTPYETIKVKGGDCEDLTILIDSYLENLGIETYLVLTDTHAYSLACGVDTEGLFSYIRDSLAKQVVEELGKEQEVIFENGKIYFVQEKSLTFALEGGQIYYYGGSGSELEPPLGLMDIKYSISSSKPINVFIVPSRDDFEAMSNKQGFRHYEQCQLNNILSIREQCMDLKNYGGIILQNKDLFSEVTISLEISFYAEYLLSEGLADSKVKYYEIDGKECVVLDATAGPYGYPGYDGGLEGKKTAINVVTKEYFSLT